MTKRILIERTIGETRAVAMDETGDPVGLFLYRPDDERLRFGDCVDVIVRKTSGNGILFLETKDGFRVTLRSKEPLHDGQHLTVRIVCEAFDDKLPRGENVQHSSQSSPLDRWIEQTGPAESPEMTGPGDDRVAAAFDEAISLTAQISGGGALTFSPTRALTAIDIDSAGRVDKARAASRALNLNRAAAIELARQIELRNLGGLFVLDCVAPVNRDAGLKVRAAFQDAFRKISSRHSKALAPSEFGLMELSVERRLTPVLERVCDQTGAPSARSIALEGLRQAEREAQAQPMANFDLCLPHASFKVFTQHPNWQHAIDENYRGRISVVGHDGPKIEVIRR